MIINHLDILSFACLNDDIITKAFLPKKVVNFKTKSKVIVSVSGNTEEYTPFCVHEIFFSDPLHLKDFSRFTAGIAIILVRKHLKDNSAGLPTLPDEFSSDSKVKKLRIISFPLILPIIKGLVILERKIGDKDVYEKIGQFHDLYAD